MSTNPSGRSGVVGKVADAFDRLPVKGALAVAVTIGGTAVALAHGGLAKGDCRRDPLQHVYNPKRLVIVERCAEVTGTVVQARREHDGDWHVNMRMDEPGWTNDANVRGQHGLTVVEFVPLGPKPPKFHGGQRLQLRVTKVYDQQHKLKIERNGWIEGHPVFAVRDVTPAGPGAAPVSAQPVPVAPQTDDDDR